MVRILVLGTAMALVGCAGSGGAVIDDGTGSGTGTATGSGTGGGTGGSTGTGTATGTGTGTGTGGTTPAACDGQIDGGPFTVESPDFLDSAGDPLAAECDWVMPDPFACNGPSPEITWSGLPEGTTHLALIFDDPDAGDYPHWGVYDIPCEESGLEQGASGQGGTGTMPAGAGQLTNGAGFRGYYGSCPPTAHVYRWRLYAMDQTIPNPPTGTANQQFDALETWATQNQLGMASLCHIYRP